MNTDPLANGLLADLPRSDFDMIATHLTIGHWARATVLAEVGDRIRLIDGFCSEGLPTIDLAHVDLS